jgi:xylulokinase
MDQFVGAVGAGNIAPGVVTETTGGALAIVVTLDSLAYDPQGRIPLNYHARPDTYCLLPWAQTAGMALRWFRDRFFGTESRVAIEGGVDPYDLMTRPAQDVPAGSDGLVVLPHLEGAFCPEFDPSARAVFFGATLGHTRAHFTRALLESVAYMLKKNLDLVEGMGVHVSEVRSMGGGARSPLWLKIKADVLQKPVRTLEVEETACLGAALMGATATGYFDSYEGAVAQMVRLDRTIEPGTRDLAAYQHGYAQYVELYDRLAPMF